MYVHLAAVIKNFFNVIIQNAHRWMETRLLKPLIGLLFIITNLSVLRKTIMRSTLFFLLNSQN